MTVGVLWLFSRDAVGWSAVFDCGISWSYLLAFLRKIPERRSWSGSKQFDTLIVFLIKILKVNFWKKKSADDNKSMKNYPAGPCFVIQVVRLILQSSWLEKESWFLFFNCLPDVLWLLVFCGSFSQCRGLVCGVWLWHFLIILTCIFKENSRTSVLIRVQTVWYSDSVSKIFFEKKRVNFGEKKSADDNN